MLRYLLSRHLAILLAVILCGLASGAGGIGLIHLINLEIASFGTGTDLLERALIFGGLVLLLVAGRMVNAVLLMRLGQRTVAELRMQLSDLILGVPLYALQRLGKGRLLALLTEDVAVLAQAFEKLPLVVINLIVVLCGLAFIGWLYWPVLSLVLVLAILGMLFFRLAQRRALRNFQRARRQSDVMHGHFRGLLDGIKELKLYPEKRTLFLDESLGGSTDRFRRHQVAAMTTFIVSNNLGNSLFYVAIGLILFGLPYYTGLPLPEEIPSPSRTGITGCIFAVLYIMEPFATLMNALPALGQGRVALGSIDGVRRELRRLPAERERRRDFPERLKVLRLSGICHRHHSDADERGFVLGPIDLTFKAGELVFLVGANGSGKSTLALLLAGLYRPERGGIYWNGVAVTDANREHYRRRFAAVFADFHLFDGLLRLDGERDERARDYLAKLQLDHKVSIRDGEFSTLELSQGQRKRLALLAAILEDRPFYVFDEWAADQDPAFKRVFYTEILPWLKARGKTVLAITHDDGYFHLADRLIKLESGRTVEDMRTHKEAVAIRKWSAQV